MLVITATKSWPKDVACSVRVERLLTMRSSEQVCPRILTVLHNFAVLHNMNPPVFLLCSGWITCEFCCFFHMRHCYVVLKTRASTHRLITCSISITTYSSSARILFARFSASLFRRYVWNFQSLENQIHGTYSNDATAPTSVAEPRRSSVEWRHHES